MIYSSSLREMYSLFVERVQQPETKYMNCCLISEAIEKDREVRLSLLRNEIIHVHGTGSFLVKANVDKNLLN